MTRGADKAEIYIRCAYVAKRRGAATWELNKAMKKNLFLALLSLSLVLHTSDVSAQENGLLNAAHKHLRLIAQQEGYELDKVSLSFAESNFLIPTSTAGTILFIGIVIPAGIGAAVGLAGGAAIGAVGGLIVGTFRGSVGATLRSTFSGTVGGALGGAAVAGGIVGFLSGTTTALVTAAAGNSSDDHLNDVHRVDDGYYRAQLHYTMVSGNEGSCLIHYNHVSYEIDDCSHDRIFPQSESGIWRIGNEVDTLDRLLGQDSVVAVGTYAHSSPEDSGDFDQLVTNGE